MSDWSTTGGGLVRSWHATPPAARTAIVFTAVTALALIIPNAPAQRVAVALAAGWLVAFGYAWSGWWRAGRTSGSGDDALRVEPLAAGRELGVRFDESPYLAPPAPNPPPTPDARLDPDSTLAEPRWQAGATVERVDVWDRAAPEPVGEDAARLFADQPVDPAAPEAQPGNAAEQWDGTAEPVEEHALEVEQPQAARLPSFDGEPAMADRPTKGDRLTPKVVFGDDVQTPVEAPSAEAAVVERSVVEAAVEPSTDELLGKLMAMAADRRAPTRALHPAAADKLAGALRALRTAT